jgi:hypothetical protein
MIDGDSLAFEEYAPLADLLSDENITEWTGKHDKNAKEIYEGDILLAYHGGKAVVEYDASCAGFRCRNKVEIFDIDPLVWNRREVIGNIFQNPELLK